MPALLLAIQTIVPSLLNSMQKYYNLLNEQQNTAIHY